MKGCHNCETTAEIAEGKLAEAAWEEVPCSMCDVLSGMGFAVEFDEDRLLSAEVAPGEPGGEAAGDQGEEMLPVSVMREVVVGLLKLKPELRDVVAWRFAGLRYDDIAVVQGVTRACAEKRHRRAMEQWPALQALFPRKAAKHARRRRQAAQANVE